ncbi:MAG TPA: glutamine synthetase beta-grasp domain-containing protein, partial [Bacteroidota bacterium]|nr:glutamine synthetase beta-grasp domain-containing protein [Bacteroidota bacterium]
MAKKNAAAASPSSVDKVFKFIKDNDVQIIDMRFCDMLGQWQHFSLTKTEFDADAFVDGLGFDGSSIRGFQRIHESDMLLFPDPGTMFLDPFCAIPTLAMICDVKDPMTHKSYSRDPRYIATKAEEYLKKTGLGDECYVGPEA